LSDRLLIDPRAGESRFPELTMHTVPIIALDVSGVDAALAVVAELGDLCRFYKVGNELFTAAGPAVVEALRERGCQVFLDLKFHDIPNTVRGACRNAAAMGARLVTVHASGGRRMLEAAVDGVRTGAGDGTVTEVLAVTALTSLTPPELAESWGRPTVALRDEAVRLARLAGAAGIAGVVCGGSEAAAIRADLGPEFRILIPGIRLAGGEAHDQARVVTPAEAAAAGATYVVVGRAVTASPAPRDAMRRVLAELSPPVAKNT
jgi:orotidine-5'-phosphate decarboxylase